MTEAAWEILRTGSGYIDLDEIGVPEEAKRSFSLAMGRYVFDGAHGFWYGPEHEDGHCDPNRFVVDVAGRVAALGDLYNGQGITSPIEHMLAGALLWLNMDWAGFPKVDYLGGPKDNLEMFGPVDGVEFSITPQARIGTYRADFLLWFRSKNHIAGLVVECDGHDFHEKTKEQAARDKKRDRELLTAGFPVVRFTGSEIFKDALGCVDQIRVALSDQLHRVSKDGGLY